MDETSDKILDAQYEILSSDNEKTIHFYIDLPPLSGNYLPPSFNINYSPREENANEIYPTSDILVKQPITKISNNVHKYRIHLGTQPSYYKEGHITFTESQKLHSKVIDVLQNFLTSSNINCEFIKKDVFSNSAWGLEPYAYMLLSSTNEIAKGVAGIIGLALKQDAIGLYSDNGIGWSHPVFTISMSDGSLFTKENALILMKKIVKHCTCLSAQFDENGRNLEFHDFENSNETPISIQRIQAIIDGYFGKKESFHITQSIVESDLLKKEDYQNAINQAGFESFSKLIELTRLHDNLYDKPESIESKINLLSYTKEKSTSQSNLAKFFNMIRQISR